MNSDTERSKLPRVAVAGVTGTISRLCVASVMHSSACELSGGILRPGHSGADKDLGDLADCAVTHVLARDDAESVMRVSQAVIDFTVPAATVLHATLAAEHGVALIAATTGLDDAQETVLRDAATRTPIVRAPNMSLVNAVMTDAVERIARFLDADYDVEVLNQVHRRKRDLPSGTAIALGAAAASGRDVDLDEVAVHALDGEVAARPRGSIGFANTRGGEGGGAFSVYFYGSHDALEITHRVHDRELYAAVALRAALWAVGKPPGLYGLMDVLEH